MKPLLKLTIVSLFVCTFATVLLAEEKPQVTLEAIRKLRADRLEEAKTAGKRPDYAAISAEALAKAKAGAKDVDPAKVDLTEAQAWYDLFTQAQDYKSARTVAGRWAAGAQGEEKFKAQLASMSADQRLKDIKSLAKTLDEIKPTGAADGIRVAIVANGYVLSALKDADMETAMKVLTAGEAAVPKDGFADDKQRDLARQTGEQLATTRKLIEENPGKEVEALEKQRREALIAAFTRRAGGSSTNAASSAAAAREARDAKFAKLIGVAATDFKPGQTLGDFKGLGDLKGKVVILDFFAHWCGPCIASLPSMRELYDGLKPKGLEMVGVTRFYGYYQKENRTKRDMPEATELTRMKDFIVEKKINWPVAFVGKEVFDAYGCSGIPHVVVIDKAGKIHKIKVGYNKNGVEEFHKEIEKLLAS